MNASIQQQCMSYTSHTAEGYIYYEKKCGVEFVATKATDLHIQQLYLLLDS